MTKRYPSQIVFEYLVVFAALSLGLLVAGTCIHFFAADPYPAPRVAPRAVECGAQAE